MTNEIADFRPVDSNLSPRFTGVSTFMRTRSVPLNDAGVDVGVVGVPMDLGTLFRGGSRLGPAGIRNASRQLRLVNSHTGVAPFDIARIADLGDVVTSPVSLEQSIDSIKEAFLSIRQQNIRPLVLGGDHTIPLPILRGLVKDKPVGLIQFDAHSDTADEYCGCRYTHATTFRRAVEEGLIDPKRTIQIGLRGQVATADSYDWAREAGMTLITMDQYYAMGRDAVIAEARRVIGDASAYLSFDIDGLDSIYCPGTGVPEPGGYSMLDAQLMLRGFRGLDLIGADISEVSPPFDVSDITSLHAAHLAYDMLCLLAESATRHK